MHNMNIDTQFLNNSDCIKTSDNVLALTQKLEEISDILKNKSMSKKNIKEKLNESKNILKNIKESIDLTNNTLNTMSNIGNAFSKKFKLISEILKSIEKFIGMPLTGGVYGSFIRQLFEVPFALKEKYKNIQFANPIGHDIDIALFNSKPNEHAINNIVKFMEFSEQYIRLADMSNESISAPTFGEYKMLEIKDTTIKKLNSNDPLGKRSLLDIPKYLIKLLDNNNKIVYLDVIAWLPLYHQEIHSDFDVNCFLMTSSGIQTMSSINLFSVIDHIDKREAECTINFPKLQSVLNETLTKKEKSPHLSTIGFFMANRLKIFSYGYNNLTSNYEIPEYEIEKKEICYITTCEPPYINLSLNCGHKLSVMSYLGEIIKNNCEYTESIKCPQCRSDFILKLKSNLPSKINYWSPFIRRVDKQYESENLVNLSPILSDESKKMIKALYNSPNISPDEFPFDNPSERATINSIVPANLEYIESQISIINNSDRHSDSTDTS